ncbi:kinase-like domain-containing protein [Pisolithus orientalis]|uniref:kinase-like domain-containing protein n=1 Tax=Pisolithus orientalis TaxID=936130 RepID=UPI0022252ECA|nr:kinase-like domain-containing protein [Pisolithus orientalis]KAI6000339.1 kinase-like domain-containing protein [Pisolithus orientalis]
MELFPVLHELSERASRYSVNLNGRVTRTLGRNPLRGGTACVHHGTLKPEGTEVAIKIFYCTRSGSEADLKVLAGFPLVVLTRAESFSFKRLFREVHTWSKLRHENIVPMLGISTEFDSTLSIVSDWMPMGDARTYIQNAENDPRPLLRDIANGLYYLHSHELGPVIHGDLKGPNVLVSSDRRALLSDFGLSTLNVSTFNMTTEATRGGSFPWMAPELINDCVASKESDMWAYGMTILELFTRSTPFHDCRNCASVMRRIVEKNLPARPAEESTQFRLSDAWWEICMACWRPDPSSRPTITDVVEKLKATTVCTLSSR